MSVDLPPAYVLIEDLAARRELYRDDQLEIATQIASLARERLALSASRNTENYRRRRDAATVEVVERDVDVTVDLVHPNARFIELADRGTGAVGPLGYALRVLALS